MSSAAPATAPSAAAARPTRTVIVLNVCLTIIAIAIAVGGMDLPHTAHTPGWVVAPLVVSLVVAGTLRVAYRYGSELEDLDVFEAVVAPALLLYGVEEAVAIVVVAKVASEVLSRRELIKAWFNVAQWATAAGGGAVVFGLVNGSRAVDARSLWALAAAMATVALINHAALTVVLSLVTQRSPLHVLRDLRPAIVSGWLVGGALNLAFGLLISAAAVSTAVVVPLFVIPLAVLHLASQHLGQARASRGLRLALQDAATALSRPLDPRDAVQPFLGIVGDAFSARAARLVLLTDRGSDVHHLSLVPSRRYERWQAEPLPPTTAEVRTAIAIRPSDETFAELLEPGWRDCLLAPLSTSEETIGFLYVVEPQGFPNRDGDLAALEAMSAGAANSLARAEMVDELVTVHLRSELMLAREGQVLESIASGDELSISLGKVAAFVEAAIPTSRCLVAISGLDARASPVDVERKPVPPLQTVISNDLVVGSGPRPPDSLLVAREAGSSDREHVVIPDVRADPRWDDRADGEWQGFRACWLVSFDAEPYPGMVANISVALPEAGAAPDDAQQLALTVAQRLARMATEQTLARADLLYQARHDRLTGLGNRVAFLEATTHASARSQRSGRPFAVLFLDLDTFKHVNDSMGHDAGDELLIGVARRLHDLVRSADSVARHGGDEFTVLFEDLSDSADVHELAVRISAALREPYVVKGTELTVTASIGVAMSDHHATATQLIERADAAMYHAKQRGRNRVEVFDDERTRHFTQFRLSEQAELRRALDAGEFIVHYQPIRSLPELTAIGVEALVRRRAADGSLLGPDRFIPLAEETGLIVPLGSFVLEQACQQGQRWRDESSHASLGVSVNVSARQISDGDLVETVKRALAHSKLPADALTLEITESTLMEVTESGPTLHELRDLGVAIAIDDFGTGYSSLNYLRGLPVDVIKLDRVFLHELGTDRATEAIVSSTVNLARTLGLCLVAEGIETGEQLQLLRDLGCPEGQGYHLGRPVDACLIDFAPPLNGRAA